ncbi:MAG: hypothetical protein D6B25_14710 [Desulfobulbaceae bacterium]|nr:MAG: hypothetical protein D6B25_14710 [Desulfobulbaceae bacterium]
MAVYKRDEIKAVLDSITDTSHAPVYLIFGERYLCRETAELIESALLKKSGSVHRLDGTTLSESQICARILSLSILPGLQIYSITDSGLFHSKKSSEEIWKKAEKGFRDNKPELALKHLSALLAVAQLEATGNRVFSDISPDSWSKFFGFAHPDSSLDWADKLLINAPPTSVAAKPMGDGQKLIEAITNGLPPTNILLLISETVDKRKKLFSQIKKHGVIVDCSVAAGSSRAAQKQQQKVVRELALETLQRFEKSAQPKVLEALYERIGFHPVAVVMEVEKLCLYAGEASQITVDHLNTLVSRTREDALFELTDAIGSGKLSRSLKFLESLLKSGTHSLAVVASLRNYFRKMLIITSLQNKKEPRWSPSMNANLFQNQYLPALKEQSEWPDLLAAHPYALFVSFSKAARYKPDELKRILSMILEAEFNLKGSAIPPQLILEELVISMINGVSSERR